MSLKSTSAILAFALLFTGCAALTSSSNDGHGKIIKPEQTDLMPKQGVDYVVVVPPLLYAAPGAGPTQRGTRMAWDLANEFAYRTALRHYVTMPAARVGTNKDVWYVVDFDGPDGKPAGSVIVNIADRTVAVE